jgi:hypothetical protein
MALSMNHKRRHYAISLEQAAKESPALAQVVGQAREAADRLRAIQELMPTNLRPLVKAGPIEGDGWCLLVSNNSAATKLRQLLPALQAHLRSKGWNVQHIRLRVRNGDPWQNY